MTTLSDVPQWRHGAHPHVTPLSDEHAFEHDGQFGVTYLPVRTIPGPGGALDCEPNHRHQPADTDHTSVVAVDRHTTRGAWRRNWCCGRCISDFTAGHPEATVWVPTPGAELAEPRALGQVAEWPGEARGAA